MRKANAQGDKTIVATTFTALARPTGKPRELQGFSNRVIFHPAARRLAQALVPTGVTPNMVSVTGMAMVVATALLYAWGAWPVAILIGFALHLAWHVVDGADGDLARLTGRASANGELIDGLCDYGGHIVLYLTLAATLDDVIGGWAWAWAIGAGVSRAAQSIYAESQRRTYLWWTYGVPWMQTAKPSATGAMGAAGGLYLWLSTALTGPTRRVNALVEAAEGDPVERKRIAVLAHEAGRRTLPLQIALGANPRTVLLGLSMLLLRTPLWFFVVEATMLNLLLVVSWVQQARSCDRLAREIARGPL